MKQVKVQGIKKSETLTDERVYLMTQKLQKRILKERERLVKSTKPDSLKLKALAIYWLPYTCERWIITDGNVLSNGDMVLRGFFHDSGWHWGSVRLSELRDRRNMEHSVLCLEQHCRVGRVLKKIGAYGRR